MKTLYILVCFVLLSIPLMQGQGFETFANFPCTTGSYTNGSFPGLDGSEWTYIQCRGDKYIELPTPCLGKKRNPLAKVVSGTLHNGCQTIIFSYRQAFSTAVNLDLLINGEFVKNVISAGGNADTGVVYSSDSIILKLPGNFIIEFRQADSLNSGQVCIDNIFWTSYETGLGNEEKITDEFSGRPVIFLCRDGKQVRVNCHTGGEKKLQIFSMDGRLIREVMFTGLQIDLQMDDCHEGMYVAIVRDKENNMISTGKLVLH